MGYGKDEQRKDLSEQPGRRPMLLEVVRQRMRLRHLSYHTEKQYVYWIRYFVRFHGKRHPSAMGEKEIEAFLSHLAIKRGISPSTQNQALNALIFLFRHVLNKDLGECKNFTRAKHRRHVPVADASDLPEPRLEIAASFRTKCLLLLQPQILIGAECSVSTEHGVATQRDKKTSSRKKAGRFMRYQYL